MSSMLAALALAVLGSVWAVGRSLAPWIQWLTASIALASLSVLVRVRPWRSAPPSKPQARVSAPGAWLLAVAAVAAAGLFALETARHPEGAWDAWGHWNRTARALVRAPAGSPLPFAPGPLTADYPLMLPGAVAAGWDWAGREGQAWPVAVAAAFSLMIVAGLHGGLRRTRNVAAAVLVAVPCFPAIAASQCADAPLAALWTLGTVVALRAMERLRGGEPAGSHLWASGFLLAMAAWTKNEGALLLGLLPVFVALELPKGGRLSSAGWFLSGAAAPLTALVGFKATVAPPNYWTEGGVAVLARLAEPGRWLALASETGLHVIRFKDWGLALPALLIAATWLWRGAREVPACRVLARAAAGVLLAYALVFLTTPLDPVFHLKTAMGRLFFQVWPLLVLWCGLAWEAREARNGATGSPTPAPREG